MGRGWGKLPFTSLNGERGGLYIRHGRCDVSGQPASASIFASLDFLQSAATSPLQTLPEASEQDHAVSRVRSLCPALAEWRVAHRGRSGDDGALQAALELGGYTLRLPPVPRRARLALHVPIDTQLPRGLLASLGAAEPATGRPRDFFAWVEAAAKGAAAAGRLQLFLLTHRGATFAVMADGRDKVKPTMHVFDPLGCTLQASNQQAYAVTFVASRRTGLEFNERPPGEQAADFFARRFYHTMKVDKAVMDALASALERSPEAGAAALKAAVRRHAIVEVQEVLAAAPVARKAGDQAASQLTAQLALLSNPKASMEAIYETLVAPAPAPLHRRPRLALPPRPRATPGPPARASSTPQPWGRALNPRSNGAAAAATGQQRPSQDADTSPPTPALPAAAAAAPLSSRRSAPSALISSAAAAGARPVSFAIDRTPLSSPQRTKKAQAGVVAGTGPPPQPPRDHHRRCGSAGSVAGSMAGSFCASPRSHTVGGHARRSKREALLFVDVDERVWPLAPSAPPPYPPSSRRKGSAAKSLRRAASVLGSDVEAESRAGRSKRRAASVAGSSAPTEVPDSFKCKRDAAKLQAAIAKAVNVPATGKPQQDGTPPPPAPGTQSAGTAAAATAATIANPAPAVSPPSASSTNAFARRSDSSGGGGGEGGVSSVRRPSAGAASDNSSALRSTNSDGSNTASNGKASANSVATDSAYGRASQESLRVKYKGRNSGDFAGDPMNSSGSGGGKLTSIPEPAAPKPAKASGGFMAGILSVFRCA